MQFFSVRLIVSDIKQMSAFYELVTQSKANWLAPVFAELSTAGANLALGSEETVALFKAGSAQPAQNRSAILEFLVDNVDEEFERLKDKVALVHEPKELPWGNRTFQFKDPEGNLVSLFTPVSADAKARFKPA